MKKVTITAALFCTLAVQGCTTNTQHHHHHYSPSKNIGIASPPKGSSGTVGKPGIMGASAAQIQRKQELMAEQRLHQSQQGSTASGSKGPQGSAAIPGQAGILMPGNPLSQKEPENEGFNEKYWAGFLKDSVQTLIRVCAPLQCFKW